jgi:hypothetical protein
MKCWDLKPLDDSQDVDDSDEAVLNSYPSHT